MTLSFFPIYQWEYHATNAHLLGHASSGEYTFETAVRRFTLLSKHFPKNISPSCLVPIQCALPTSLPSDRDTESVYSFFDIFGHTHTVMTAATAGTTIT